MSQPNVYCFNSMLQCAAASLEQRKDEEKLTLLKEYAAHLQASADPSAQIALHVRYWRIQKCYDREHKRLEVNVVPGTAAERVTGIVLEELRRHPQVTELPGIAPQGDLERKIQAWVDANSETITADV